MAIVVTMGLRAARTLTKGDLTRSGEAGSNTVAMVVEPGQEAQVGQRPQRVSGDLSFRFLFGGQFAGGPLLALLSLCVLAARRLSRFSGRRSTNYVGRRKGVPR
jgi:hypothetical protein